MTSTIKTVDIALKYATQFGWAVVPCYHVKEDGTCSCYKGEKCNSAGKHPRVEWNAEKVDQNKFKDPDWIRENFKENDNIGVITGEISGISVIDLDTHDKTKEQALTNLFNIIDKSTECGVVSKTGGGGLHFYYKYGGIGDGSIPGVGQIKSGGIVIEYPSNHVSGVYEWISPCNPINSELITLTEFPKLLTKKNANEIVLSGVRNAGNRHDALKRFGVILRNTIGFNFDEMVSAMKDYNRNHCNPPTPDSEVVDLARWIDKKLSGGLVDETTFYTRTKTGHIKYKYHDIANYVHEVLHTKTVNRNNVFCYENGLYKNTDIPIRKMIREIMLDSDPTSESGPEIVKVTNTVLETLASIENYDEYPFNKRNDIIPVSNGVLEVDFNTCVVKLCPDDPKYNLTYKLNVVYDQNAKNDVISTIIKNLFEENKYRDLLYQAPAHALLSQMGHVKNKKAYYILGPPDSGKTTYLNLLSKGIFGEKACSSISIQDICDSTYKPAQMVGKAANIYDDTGSQTVRNAEKFKSICGGSFMLTVEEKYKQPYTAMITAVFITNGNRLPRVEGADEAYYSRWYIIPFTKIFTRVENFEENIFTSENVSAMFNDILVHMFKIYKNGLIEGEDPYMVRDIWYNNSNTPVRYIESELEEDHESAVIKMDVFRGYNRYCGENINDSDKMGRDTFFKKIELQPIADMEGRILVDHEYIRVYKGYRWKRYPYRNISLNKNVRFEQENFAEVST